MIRSLILATAAFINTLAIKSDDKSIQKKLEKGDSENSHKPVGDVIH